MIFKDTAEEELEGDTEFPNPSQRTDPENSKATYLSSSPSKREFLSLSRLSTQQPETKFLPMLPEDEPPSIASTPTSLTSQNLTQPANVTPSSPFPRGTISTPSISPTDSHFDSTSPSVYDFNWEDHTRHGSFDFGLPQLEFEEYANEAHKKLFRGHSPPPGSGDDAKRLMCATTEPVASNDTSTLHAASSRTTLGPQEFDSQTRTDITGATALDELLAEMGYLGELILGN